MEYERLKQNDLFSPIKRNAISDDTFTILVDNVRSLPKHVDDAISENRIINNDIIGFTETQTKPSDSTCILLFSILILIINFNNNELNF